MEIAEQGDGEAIQTVGPAGQEKILAHDARTVRLEQDSISGKREGAGGCGPAKKLASCGRKRRQELVDKNPAEPNFRSAGTFRS